MLEWFEKLPVPKKLPKEGDLRLKRRFLFFPKTIDGLVRWFGVAYWLEKAETYSVMPMDLYEPPFFYEEIFWKPVKWLTKLDWAMDKRCEYLKQLREIEKK